SGGEIDRGQRREPAEPDGGKRDLALFPAAAQKRRPETEIFSHRQRRLQRVLVAEVMGMLTDAQLRITVLELELTLLRPHHARHHAQQRGFARPIAPRHHERFAGLDGKGEATEDLAAPSDASEIGSSEPHQPRPPGTPPLRELVVKLAALALQWAGMG